MLSRIVSACLSVLLALLIVAPGAFAALEPPPAPMEMPLRGVACFGTSLAWAVGDGILHTDNGGASWYRQFSALENLNAVDFVTATRGWAVGEVGSVVRTVDGGATWVVRGTGYTADFNDVDFVDESYGWVVGDAGLLLRTTDGGLTWAAASIPLNSWGWPQTLNAVSFVSRTHGWVCGPSGTAGDGFNDLYIAKTTNGGVSWTRCSNGTYMGGGSDDMWSWDDIDFVSATTGWVTGWLPGVRKTVDGAASWGSTPLQGSTAIDFIDSSHGVSVSHGGGGSYTLNGAATWLPSDLSIMHPWRDVCMASTSQVWAVAGSWSVDPVLVDGVIAHSATGGATWHMQNSSTGPVHFLGGATRYHTAVNIARMTDAPAGTVVLATGRNYPDALAASGLAGALDAVLLLTDTKLPTVVADAIADLGTTRVVIVGGDDVVSSAIETQLSALYTVERVEGLDRYETAANVAKRMLAAGAHADEVFLVSGVNFADAASAAPLAYSAGVPILLTKPGELSQASEDFIRDRMTSEVYIVGGTAAVSAAVQDEVDGMIPPHLGGASRVAAGVNRYDTSAKLANWGFAQGWADFNRIGIATGANFPDALTGGALMGSFGHALVLTDPTALSPETDAFIASAPAMAVWVMNDRGEGAVRDAVGTRLAYHLAH